MSDELQSLPPGRVWLPVYDLPSALQALELLRAHCVYFAAAESSSDHDEI